METEKVVKLRIPLTLKDGSVLSEIKIGRPKAKHLRELPEALFTGEARNPLVFLPLVALTTGVDEKELEEMDLADLMEVTTHISDFLAGSLPTGKTS